MKELLVVLAFLLSGVVGEAQAPYPPSGWRPSGPAFELPSTQRPTNQNYLPPRGLPLDPRTPAVGPTAYPGEDVSVQGLPTQGLPTQEQQPIYKISPINGQQFVGPSFNADIQNLDQRFQQSQFQAQQERARQVARQRQLESKALESRRQPTQQTPRQFAQKTTPEPNDFDTTTESLNLNEGEILEDTNRQAVPAKQKDQVSVEVTKQRLEEYSPEVFLSPLSQLRYQPQVISFDQLAQLKAPVFFQPAASQKQVAQGYDGPAHLSAFTSILAQRQFTAAQPQEQQQFAQVFIVPQQQASKIAVEQPVPQYQPVASQYQPGVDAQAYPQYQAQQVVFQPQAAQPQPALSQTSQPQNVDQQFVYQQYQPQLYQVQAQPQPNQQPSQLALNQVESFGQNQVYQQPQIFQVQPQNQQANQAGPSQVENFGRNQVYQQPQFFQAAQPQNQQANQADPSQVENFGQNQVYQQPQIFQATQPQNQQQNQGNQVESFDQSQLIYQQPQYYQLQAQQNQFDQQNPSQNQAYALYYQQQLAAQQAQSPQESLESGLDINQQGNNIDDKTNGQNDGATATAVATAFGSRTQPRVFHRYGAPVPRTQAETTTEQNDREETTENNPAVAQATAIANAEKRRNAKLRSRRVRPVFTLDRSGHLVLAQEQ